MKPTTAAKAPHEDDDALMRELCVLEGEMTGGLQTKSRAAPENKALRGAGDLEKRAIVGIGQAVIEQGRKIEAIAAKMGSGKRAIEATQHTWGTFQEVNDRRLRELKSRGRSDPLDDQQLDRINRTLDTLCSVKRRLAQMEVKRNRPPGMGARMNARGIAGPHVGAQAVFRKAVQNYIRTGLEFFEGQHLSELSRKAMHTELNPSGGYLLLPERESSPLNTFLNEVSPMRQRARVRPIMTDTFEQVTKTGPADAGWAAERQPRTETGAPSLGIDQHAVHELWAQPVTTQKLLDDATLDVEAWLTGEIAEAFALQESDAWFNGDGVNKPRGLLTYPFVAPASWAHGSFRYIPTGTSGAFPATNPADKLLEVLYSVKRAHRANATWLFNRATIGVIRKFKDSTGQYLWQPSTQAGQPDFLLGQPTDEDEYMPDIGADTLAVGCGDWKKTYLILDRLGVRVLRDPYTTKGQVSFYTTKRIGGGVQYFDAATFLKFGTS